MRILIFKPYLTLLMLTFLLLIPNKLLGDDLIKKADLLYSKKEFISASMIYYSEYKRLSLSNSNKQPKHELKVKLDKVLFKLGTSLYYSKFYLPSAIIFNQTSYSTDEFVSRKSQDKIFNLYQKLQDKELLNTRLISLKKDEVTDISKDQYFIVMARIFLEKGEIENGIANLNLALQVNPNSQEARFELAELYLSKSNYENAIEQFSKISELNKKQKANSLLKNLSQINLARAYFQSKDFAKAISIYRTIPYDSLIYRQSLGELAWSQFRSGQFRSSLSTLENLHTPYYENFFDPEPLVLRSILYYFICHFDESMDAQSSYDKNYRSTYLTLKRWIKENHTDQEILLNLIDVQNKRIKYSQNINLYKHSIPFYVVRSLLEEPRLIDQMSYLKQLQDEKNRVSKAFSKSNEPTRIFLNKIYNFKLKKLSVKMANTFKELVLQKINLLEDLNNQMDFLKVEILDGKRNVIKKMAESETIINNTENRSFYINNGYRYWPFQGEYWRDEIGNFQYLGTSMCSNLQEDK